MKSIKNIGVRLSAVLAVVAGFVSCAKDFQDDIDDLNNKYTNIDQRVTTRENQVKQINYDLQNLKVLSTAVEQGFYITEVKKTSYTYELTLSNG